MPVSKVPQPALPELRQPCDLGAQCHDFLFQFIGGGILKQGGSVHGTATAASLWATGAVGTAVGLGSFDVAVTIAAITFLTLKLLPWLKPGAEETERKAD